MLILLTLHSPIDCTRVVILIAVTLKQVKLNKKLHFAAAPTPSTHCGITDAGKRRHNCGKGCSFGRCRYASHTLQGMAWKVEGGRPKGHCLWVRHNLTSLQHLHISVARLLQLLVAKKCTFLPRGLPEVAIPQKWGTHIYKEASIVPADWHHPSILTFRYPSKIVQDWTTKV